MPTVNFIIDVYGFLIPYHTEISFQQFAGMIRDYYDCEGNAKNRYCADLIASLPGKIARTIHEYTITCVRA